MCARCSAVAAATAAAAAAGAVLGLGVARVFPLRGVAQRSSGAMSHATLFCGTT